MQISEHSAEIFHLEARGLEQVFCADEGSQQGFGVSRNECQDQDSVKDVAKLLHVHEIAGDVLLLQGRMYTRNELIVPFSSFEV